MAWTPNVANLYASAIPKGLSAKEQSKFIKGRDAAARIHDYLFPED